MVRICCKNETPLSFDEFVFLLVPSALYFFIGRIIADIDIHMINMVALSGIYIRRSLFLCRPFQICINKRINYG